MGTPEIAKPNSVPRPTPRLVSHPAPLLQRRCASSRTPALERNRPNAVAETPTPKRRQSGEGLAALASVSALFSRANARPRKCPHRTVFRTSLLSKRERKGDGLRGGFQSLAASGPSPGNQSRRQIANRPCDPQRAGSARKRPSRTRFRAQGCALFGTPPTPERQRWNAVTEPPSPKSRQSRAGLAAFNFDFTLFSRANARPQKRPHRTVLRALLLSKQERKGDGLRAAFRAWPLAGQRLEIKAGCKSQAALRPAEDGQHTKAPKPRLVSRPAEDGNARNRQSRIRFRAQGCALFGAPRL